MNIVHVHALAHKHAGGVSQYMCCWNRWWAKGPCSDHMGRSQVTAMQAAYMAPSWARGPDSSPGMGCSVSASSVLVAFVSVCLLLVVAPASSIPVSNTTQFAAALQDPTITEIILDPTGTGVRYALVLGLNQSCAAIDFSLPRSLPF